MRKSWSEVFRDQIRKLMNDITDDVATGCAKDYPEYRHKVCVIEGLALAEREFLDIMDRIEKSEE